VTIYVGKLADALAIPVGAIYSAGEDHYVFVRDEPGPQPRKVKLGQSNETIVEVLEGLTAGQEVLMLGAGQGRELLDLAGIKTVAPSTQPKQQGPAQAVTLPPTS
jgi:multidrug efflux pump subunit AcrA (membrane-fusion protein)